jgi:hypothetical protein
MPIIPLATSDFYTRWCQWARTLNKVTPIELAAQTMGVELPDETAVSRARTILEIIHSLSDLGCE